MCSIFESLHLSANGKKLSRQPAGVFQIQRAMQPLFTQIVFYRSQLPDSWTARTVVHTRTKAPVAGSKDPQAPPRLQLCGRTVIGAVSQFVGTSHTDRGASCPSAQLCMRGAIPTLYLRLWPDYAAYQTQTLGIDNPRNPLSPSSHQWGFSFKQNRAAGWQHTIKL